MFNINVLQDEHVAWTYLRRVIEASDPVVNSLLDTGLPVTDVAMAIAEGNPRLPSELLTATEARRENDPRQDAERAANFGWRLITRDSPEWPDSFSTPFVTQELNVQHLNSQVRGLRHAPFAVYAKGTGNLSAITSHAITVVGTRGASRYGQEVTTAWCSDFASRGYTIVSGGAEGIDARAHTTALDLGAPTVAIMAGALDRPYPKKNIDLLRRIVDNGGVVLSEYPPGAAPARHRFLTRNRLAAALGKATVIVEAAVRSGAINTMNWSNSMGKPTFAVPGSVMTVASQGCLKAIQEQRAQLARTSSDVLDGLQGMQLSLETEDPTSEGSGVKLSWEQTAIVDATLDPVDAVAIQEETGIPMPLIIRNLRILSSMGLVRRVGNMWQRV